jgi:F420-dependent oxidoreductase-like protein
MPHRTVAVMQLRIFTEPQQGASYDDLLRVARAVEDLGFDAFFRSDHYLKMGDVSGQPGPTDAWITLAGLARETRTIRLGTLVTSMTFRWPGPLAVSVAQVDAMSGGRVELGLGAGWFENEHKAYGIPFPKSVAERFDRLSEQLEIITGLWATEDEFSYAGRYYTIDSSPGLPKPVQRPRPPIIIGGRGKQRTPSLAALFAAEYNMPFATVDEFTEQAERVRAACTAIGRDPASMTFSAALVVCVGRDEAEFARRAAAIGRKGDELRANGACGTVDEVIATLRKWDSAGAQRVYLQILDLSDLDHLEMIAESVRPAFA